MFGGSGRLLHCLYAVVHVEVEKVEREEYFGMGGGEGALRGGGGRLFGKRGGKRGGGLGVGSNGGKLWKIAPTTGRLTYQMQFFHYMLANHLKINGRIFATGRARSVTQEVSCLFLPKIYIFFK